MIRIRIGQTEQDLSWEDWESRVLDGRISPDCEVQIEAVTGDKFVAASELELYQSLVQDGAVAWRRSFTSSTPPILTALLIGLQIRIWWWARLPDFSELLITDFAKWGPPIYEQGESWRLLTMGFVQIETFHLILNMMWLAYTGSNLERALGRLNLLVIYLGSILGGSLASLYWSPESMSVGASGGVFGLVAASVVFGFLRPELLPQRAQNLYGAALLPYLILMLLSGLSNEGTDNWSHLGGLLTGGTLAFLLDPAPLQRSPRWNRKVQSITYGLFAASLLIIGLKGPNIYPLVDSETARWGHLSSNVSSLTLTDPAIQYRVPHGWEAGRLVSGEAGFRSPNGGAAFGVRVGVTEVPMTGEEIAKEWSDKLIKRFPSVVISPVTTSSIGEHPAVALNAKSESGQTLIEWRTAVKGCWVLEEVWEVSEENHQDLSPLVRRLRSNVNWSTPSPLSNARLAYEQLPNSLNIQLALARALAEAGELEESLPFWTQLVSENKKNNFVQTGFLEVIRWYPEQIPDALDEIMKILQNQSTAAIIVDIAITLEQIDQATAAQGLLEVAWGISPADRSLKRARRSRHLWTRLDDKTNLPYHQTHNLNAKNLVKKPMLKRSLDKIELQDLIQIGQDSLRQYQDLATQVHREISTNPKAALRSLLLLKNGAPPEDVPNYLEGIQEELLSPDSPPWMTALKQAGVSREELEQLIVASIADPRLLPKF